MYKMFCTIHSSPYSVALINASNICIMIIILFCKTWTRFVVTIEEKDISEKACFTEGIYNVYMV